MSNGRQVKGKEIDELAKAGGAELREYLQAGGRLWDTKALQTDFEVEGFSSGFVVVRRKKDGQLGTMKFIHHPRWYYAFKHHTD